MGATSGKCHREKTADGLRGSLAGTGKGETVVQETTSGSGDRAGSANPNWSKAK